MLDKLNFPGYNFKIIIHGNDGQSSKVFDIVRRKYVALTGEEWVRQHLLHYLVHDKKVPKSLSFFLNDNVRSRPAKSRRTILIRSPFGDEVDIEPGKQILHRIGYH